MLALRPTKAVFDLALRLIKGATRLSIPALALIAFATPEAHALKFNNQFIEFELPAKWNCQLEGAEWVCQSGEDAKKRDAIIVLAAKLKSDQDSLEKYQEYLSKPRVFTGPGGRGVTSQPKYADVKRINDQPWVDSLHLESEIPGFYTRYLATVKEDIGVLVTYSINKAKYQEYLPQFEEMVKSLKVFRKKGSGLNIANQNSDLFRQPTVGNFVGNQVYPDQPAQQQGATGPSAPKPAQTKDNDLLLYGLLGAAVLGFMIYKKRRSGGG